MDSAGRPVTDPLTGSPTTPRRGCQGVLIAVAAKGIGTARLAS